MHRCLISRPLEAILGAALVLATTVAPAHAHWADLAVAEIIIEDARAEITLAFPTGLAGFADDDGDGQLSGAEVRAHRAALSALLAGRIRLTDGAQAGVLTVEPVEAPTLQRSLNATPGTHSTVRLIYVWPRPVERVTIHYDLFAPGTTAASCLATIYRAGRMQSVVFTPENREISLILGRGALWDQIRGFLVLGIEHILTGYDHVLFLLSLLMIGGGLRYLLKVVSAFTVAHSITLSLAVLNVVSLPARWVESAIALSIIYVAAENIWRQDRAARDRWLVTFGFGLVHGLGFASILKEFAIQGGNLAVSLASFNLGVEVGQIAVVTAAFALLQVTRPWPRAMLGVRRLASAGAAGVGLVWFLQRALLP
jgi:hydrogenase/urease accessory protein HupE